jgi:DNA-binding LytR/AlgR family response regulator
VDYVVKPIERERLAACVARLQARLAERAPRGEALAQGVEQLRALLGALPSAVGRAPKLAVIQAQVGSVVLMVPIERVIYFEAADKYVRVVTSEHEHLIRTSLKELMPQLDATRFWQVHRGTVVRAEAIASALREESGKVILTLHGRSEKLNASRLYAHLFRGM